MLPIRRALKPAVEWASPCPLVAVDTAAGATTSLVMGAKVSKGFTAQIAKARRLIVQRSSRRHAKMHKSLDGNLGPHFNHPPCGNLEIVGGVIGRAAHRDEQVIL